MGYGADIYVPINVVENQYSPCFQLDMDAHVIQFIWN